MSMKFTDEYKSQFADDEIHCPSETDIAIADPSWFDVLGRVYTILLQRMVEKKTDPEAEIQQSAEQIATDHIIRGKSISVQVEIALEPSFITNEVPF
tara:strand:+ start:310 stop:600 length:291 start_codon:yes stop_codon:yes gene_type:complete